MTSPITSYLHWIRNRWRMSAFPGTTRRPGSVMIVLFHGLFADRREIASGLCDPQQGITVAFFRRFLETLLGEGIAFRELEAALRQPQSDLSVVITFDDGYSNNARARPVLEEFAVPATFFISTSHVAEQKAFWWDALYREGHKRGATAASLHKQRQLLKGLRADQIESRMTGWFGARALQPLGDCDRPFTTGELTAFARSPYVALGNHTSDHGILTNYDPPGVRAQVLGAQQFLAGVTGTPPRSIAYPNGGYDATVLEALRDTGLEIGLTLRTGLNVGDALRPMELRRLTIWDVPDPARQARVFGGAARW
jgi:peptidoglycan/xylan/chitin deacetylase (PgdA/CDA1 family)